MGEYVKTKSAVTGMAAKCRIHHVNVALGVLQRCVNAAMSSSTALMPWSGFIVNSNFTTVATTLRQRDNAATTLRQRCDNAATTLR
jgi:hypothetical protein